MEKSIGPWNEYKPTATAAESGPWDEFKAPPEKPRTRGLFEAINDTVIEGANAAAGGVSAAANFFKPGNAVSEFIDENVIKVGEARQSDVVRAEKKAMAQGIQEADGIGGELAAVGKYVVNNPILAAAQAAGSFAVPGAAAKVLGRVGGIGAGAAMAGGDAAGTAYDLSKQAGSTEDQAVSAGRQASLIPAAVGGVTGAFGAERLLAGGKGFAGNAASRALKTGASEAGQEAVEEGVTAFEGQRAAMPYDATIDPTKGVAAAAGMGAIMGGATGAGASLLTGGSEPAATPANSAAQPASEQPSEQNLLALPAPQINVGPDGAAETTVDRNARFQRIQDGDIVDVTPIVKRSEQMGLNPAAGAMSAAAAVAVDTGAADQVQQQAAMSAATEADANTAGVPVVDYADLSDEDRAAVDDYYRRADEETRDFIGMGIEDDDGIPDFDAPGNASTEDFLRAIGANEQEIQDAISTTSAPAGPLQSAAGNGPVAPDDAGSAQQGAGADETQTQGQGLTTTGETTLEPSPDQAVQTEAQRQEAQPAPADLKAPRGILAKKAEADAARAASTTNGQATQPTAETAADAGTVAAPATGRAGVLGVNEQGAVPALSNVQDAPQRPAGTEAETARGEASAPEGGNAAAAAGVPAAPGAGDVQADGVKKLSYVSKEDGERLFGVPQKRQAAIDRIAKGTAYFGTKDKAADFITKSGIKDTHEVVMAKPGRFEVRAKAGKGADVAQTEPKKEPRGVLAKLEKTREQKAAALADYFTPGNIVKSYGGHDEVLSYLPADENGAWSVTVHAIGRRGGQWVRLGKPQDARIHSTMPDASALAAGPIARLPYQAAADVAYTEPRADGQPFPNAVDRGVKPAAVSQPKPEKQPEASAAAVPASQQETAKAPAEPAAPTPQPVKPEPSANTIFTEDAAAAARALLKRKLSGGTLNSGIDPELLQAGITLAGYHIEKGARTFAAYAKAMVSDLGDGVKPYLKSWYMGVKYDPRASVFDGMDSATVVEAADIDAVAKEAPAAKTLTESLYQAIRANEMPKDNPALKKLVESFDGKPADQERMKQAQEALETAIVMVARDMVAKKEGDRTTFDILLRLYERQPNLNIRTSTSIANQAYSTPAPLAYLASRLAGITKATVAHEPTGGTGMLLIGADPAKAIVNELNDLRIEALKAQGFKPTQKDAATQMLVPEGTQPDAVVTNPPFGSIKDAEGKPVKVKVDGFSLGQIDHLIAARALDTMKEGGRATLILGANKVAGGLSTDDRIFFNWLYSHYNVVGHFEVEGDLYNRQGAGWPVRVITINGRQKSDKFSPVAGTIQRVDNWDAVYEQFTQSLNSAQAPRSRATPSADIAGGRVAASVATPSQAGGREPAGGARGAGDVAGAGARAVPDRAKPAASTVGAVPDEQRLNAQPYVPQPQPGQNPDGAVRSAKPAGTASVEEAKGNEFQLPYTPRSSRKDEGVLIPANMAQPTQDALSRLEDEVGDIDEFARKELGYDTVDSLHNALMGLQVDSVATSIHQIKQGKAVVIADQTGIGKGRQAASIIRWAALHGMTPVFVSVKPSLFTDMYGDLADIGTNDVTPFIMNSDAWVAGDGGTKLFANKPTGHKNVIQEIANSGQLPAGSNALFMTYSQINVANVQRQALMALAPNAVFVLDESHNAAGASSTGEFVIGTLEAAKGVVYLSATYAKRPDNMPLYFKTDIGDAAADTEGLAVAMASGGLPLQTVVSNNLVKAGQMFRRERSYDGVSIASVFDSKHRDLHERMSNEATKALRAIVSADRMFHEVYVKQLAEQLAATGATVQDSAGNQIEQGVQHTEFSSVVHNFVKQMLLGLKAQSAADEAIASLKRGEKPIIAVENTMGSFLNEYAAANGIGQGESLGTFDYRTVLTRALARSRVVIEVGTNGDKVKRPVSMEQLDAQTQAAYKEAQAVIDGLTLNIPVSPIDWMRAEIARAGFKVAEITGRNLSVDYGDPKKPMLSAIDAAEQKDKVNTTREFNGGKLDALILNVAGSTGISLHASEKFEDQRQRHMIVAQAAGDINIFMQMLGRVHRTGQVRLPKYTILSVDLPTEKRPTAVLSIKMKSLNANTSSNTESATSVKSSDILNKYGDQIVNQYLRDNYALARALDLADSIGDDPTEDIARKATGRLALQPIATQHVFYDEVEAQYTALIDYLNKTNQNDLEPRTFDFDAKEIRQEVLFEGPNKATPFGEDAIYGEYSIKAQGTPMKPEEIRATMAEHLGDLSPAAYTQKMLDELDAKFNAYYATLDDAGKDAASSVRNIGRDFLSGHKIGSTFRVDINSEPFNAVVMNVRNAHKETGNPYSLSKIQVSVAVNGALRSLSVPATQFSKIEVSGIAPMFKIEQLFKEQPPNQRETAKIITGNLLAAYGEMQGVRGTIITFTKQDGTSEQGILLPKLFDYSKNTRGDYRLQDGAAALKFLQQSDNKDIGRFGIMTRDGNVRVLPSGQGIRVQVPKSKLKGAKYFLDKDLIAAGGDFVTLGNFMVSNVTAPADAVKVLDLLMKKQALYALPSMADEAKALTGGKADPEDEANYGTKERGQGTPADRAVMAMAGDGKSADEILRFIANASKSPFNRQIAHLLRRTGANPAVSLGGDMGGGAGFRFLAKYSRKNHEVTLSQGAADRAEQIFLHETVHAATLLALDRGGEHADRMKALYESVKKQGLSDAYGMKNVGEFVAEAFTNKEFQKALKGYKAPGGTAWDRFVAAVRRILGMSDRSQDALSAALELGVEVMRENVPLRKARSFSAEDAPAFAGVDQTETPAFRAWFGDSKVVDSAGKPLVVYHGTGADISKFLVSETGEFGGGIYMTPDTRGANDYAIYRAQGRANVMPLFVKIENPASAQVASNVASWKGAENAMAELIKRGYDGVIDKYSGQIVAFRPEQIKSATGNRGTFDPEDADIAHFGMADAASLKQSALDQIKQFDVKTAPKNTWAHYRGMAMQALGRRQIVDLYAEELPQLEHYNDLVQRMDAEKNETGAEADKLAQDWSKLKDGEDRRLAELMHDATLAQVDPSKAQEPGTLTIQYKALESRYNAMTPGAKALFGKARDMYKAHYTAVQKAIKERIERSEMSDGQKRQIMAKMDEELFKELKGVYFPLARFGQYVIVVKDANGEVKNVTRSETVKEAEAARKELQKAFPAHMGNTVGKVLKQAEFNAGRDAVGKGFMADLMGALDSKGVDDELRDTVAQLYLSSLPDLSWAKHGIHRKGTPGFSQDARRAFAQNMFHGARYLAKLRYADQLQDQLAAMQDHIKAYDGVQEYDSVEAQQVVDEMVKRHEFMMNPKSSPVSTALTSFGFLFHMGLSPASAMVNLTQTALVAFPQMGAKWGFTKASAALIKASDETVRAKNDLSKVLKGDELDALNRAINDGTIDVTMAHDLAGIAQGEDQGVMWKVRPVMRAASFMFHHAEKFNRQATFLAAYRLAKEANPMRSFDRLYEDAQKATYDGHFDYSAGNRPRLMQGNWQKVIFLFKQYGQNMMYSLWRNAYQSVKALDPKERAQARKTLAGMLATHAAAAGVLGLPIVGPLLTIASFFGSDDDEPWDAEVAIQNAMAETLGPKAAEVLARGFSRLTPFDISGRVALNKLILPDVQEGLEGKEWAESAMAAALGPVAGIGVNVARGMQKITDGDYMRGIEDMLPTALRGPIKAMRYANEGAVDKTGIVITDEVSAAGVLGQASGFSPSQVRRDTERRSAIYGYDRALLERRSVLMRMFADAQMAGDTETVQDVRQDIAAFNEKNPNRRITVPNLMQSVRNRQKRIDQAQDGVYLPAKRRDALEAVTF